MNWVTNHLGLSAGGSLLIIGMLWQQALSYIKKTLADELAEIDKIDDPDWKAWAVSTLTLISNKFPVTGAQGAVDELVKKFPKLSPLSGSLVTALENLQEVVKADLDAQVKKDGK